MSAPVTIALDLPSPPSVNRTRRAHGPGMARLHAWHQRADLLVMATRRLRGVKIVGPFEAHIIISNNSRLDIDNAVKAVIDYAVRIELVPDDRHLRRLVVERGDAAEGCRLILRELVR
jgi:Holliday junction resolvase RusA-like endonuclease